MLCKHAYVDENSYNLRSYYPHFVPFNVSLDVTPAIVNSFRFDLRYVISYGILLSPCCCSPLPPLFFFQPNTKDITNDELQGFLAYILMDVLAMIFSNNIKITKQKHVVIISVKSYPLEIRK